ncbi:glycosyltransferase [Ichthyenterobacterium magnum]|uniref:Glycosyl transferase family 4 n=1 Tax=Ichthyenterobacterium magnum TaxID=1230530 RepID=A0A420DV32_9FLAO|nr:glycosyltransferase [Ichthyenterobacterium magnum]RKE97987.1 glycosyl transferase family 4 [Ichthyenterobacterium magnum]
MGKIKILLVAMPSIHFFRWIENLEHSSFELYWFDVLDKGYFKTQTTITQFTHWKKRKFPYIKGEYLLSKKFPKFYNFIKPYLEVSENEALANLIKRIDPDVVHSFEMQSCSYPILKTMNKFLDLKWVYSCWGSDLFFYRTIETHNLKIKAVLNRINYLHADCLRDLKIARALGFKGMSLEVIPGGGGYDINYMSKFKEPLKNRRIILIKGYQHHFGRALSVIKAIASIDSVKQYEVIVFGATTSVVNYIKDKKLKIKVFRTGELTHEEVIKLMGQSLIYIGNSLSDGLPNTLLEAIVMGAFPIQSSPGGVTEEIIEHNKNGLLITDPEDINSIKVLIMSCLQDKDLINYANKINKEFALKRLDHMQIRQRIISIYKDL